MLPSLATPGVSDTHRLKIQYEFPWKKVGPSDVGDLSWWWVLDVSDNFDVGDIF